SPSIEMFEDSADRDTKTSFEANQVMTDLETTLDLLNLRAFHLKNGSFTLHSYGSSVPLKVNGVNISIRNFARDSVRSNRFMSADDIEITLPEQDWRFSDDNREITFKRLHFSGKKQYFQMDSCAFISYGTDTLKQLEFSASQFKIKSDSLDAFYKS